jgi:hypothetical protein
MLCLELEAKGSNKRVHSIFFIFCDSTCALDQDGQDDCVDLKFFKLRLRLQPSIDHGGRSRTNSTL